MGCPVQLPRVCPQGHGLKVSYAGENLVLHYITYLGFPALVFTQPGSCCSARAWPGGEAVLGLQHLTLWGEKPGLVHIMHVTFQSF